MCTYMGVSARMSTERRAYPAPFEQHAKRKLGEGRLKRRVP
jgi:hypothetical protein